MPAELWLWEAGTRVGERSALAVRDGGTLLVPADLPRMTQRRAREPVVAALWRVAFGREGVASAVER